MTNPQKKEVLEKSKQAISQQKKDTLQSDAVPAKKQAGANNKAPKQKKPVKIKWTISSQKLRKDIPNILKQNNKESYLDKQKKYYIDGNDVSLKCRKPSCKTIVLEGKYIPVKEFANIFKDPNIVEDEEDLFNTNSIESTTSGQAYIYTPVKTTNFVQPEEIFTRLQWHDGKSLKKPVTTQHTINWPVKPWEYELGFKPISCKQGKWQRTLDGHTQNLSFDSYDKAIKLAKKQKFILYYHSCKISKVFTALSIAFDSPNTPFVCVRWGYRLDVEYIHTGNGKGKVTGKMRYFNVNRQSKKRVIDF